MNILYSILGVTIFSLIFQKFIKKYPKLFFIISILISIIVLINRSSLINIPKNFFISNIVKGALPSGIFILIMYIGALNNNWKITKRLKAIRAELSIIACIMILAHNISLGFTGKSAYFINLVNGVSAFKPPQRFYAALISLVLILIMIPLFITSFKSIRKRMSQKSWNNLHKLSYLFYLLILVHVLVLWIPSYPKHFTDVIIYIAIYLVYLILKIIKVKK